MLANSGYAEIEELSRVIPSKERLAKGAVAIAECLQSIPCNPCNSACKRGAFLAFKDINDLPTVDVERCNGCGLCVSACPGLAIFVVDESFNETEALIKLPYEFLPLPIEGKDVPALDRKGEIVGTARVVKVQNTKTMDRTPVIWIAVPKAMSMIVRNIRP
ncbi:MAG TPA: 4Fe-4S ferredoxin [Cyanobacteria bacterium UBA8530]|nr:4Fe-4S ferredoxin [Cyanobacteria bacterium UBA8530]